MFCFVTQETVAVATRENVLSIVQILISFNFTVKNFSGKLSPAQTFMKPAIFVSWH